MDNLLAGYLILGLFFALFALLAQKEETILLGFFSRLIWVISFATFWLPLFIVALILVVKENRE